MKRWFIWGLILLSFAFTVINIMTSILGKTYINLLGITSLGPILIAIYQESDYVYISWNRLRSFFKNQTTKFEMTFYIRNESENTLKKINSSLKSTINYLELSFSNGSKRQFNGSYVNMNLLTNKQLGFTVEISNDSLSNQLGTVAIKIKFQVSSRDVFACWSLAKSFREKILEKIENNYSRIDVNIDMSSSSVNPFYRLTIKNIDNKKINNFELEFSESSHLKVKIKQYSIYATSTEISDLDRVINQYVPLTKIG